MEAASERPSTRAARTAEEPVTTRIRRQGAVPALQFMGEFPPPLPEPAGWETAEPMLAESSLPRVSSSW